MKPVFVFGIDGLPYTLARRLITEGLMPNLGQLSAGPGTLAQMHTTVPDFSCVAWTSFATGVNPGKHGIYGFQDFHPKTAEHFIPTVNDCQVPALWHQVGNAGGRSIVINLPGTYPALPLRGKMVSGFIAPEFDKSCYPATFGQTLKSLGYRMDLDGQIGLGDSNHVRQCLDEVFKARKDVFRHIIDNEYWDLCIAVITETDRLQHFYLHALDKPDHPEYEWVRKFYQELDDFIGEVIDMLDGKAELFIVSDHGFAVVKRQFILEQFLADIGLAPKVDEQCWSKLEHAAKTKVFTLDPGRFYINRKNGRFPNGCVEESEVPGILQTLKEALLDLQDPDTGDKVVNTVRERSEGFWGEVEFYAPDLVAATKPGYYFRSYEFPESTAVRNVKWEANHVWNDAIIYTPYKLDSDYQPMVWDVLPSALGAMGVNLPEGIDGRDLRLNI